MAGYGKVNPPQLLSLPAFDTSRAYNAEPTFAYAAPTFVSHPPISASLTSTYDNTSQVSQISYTSLDRPQYEEQPGPYLNVESSSAPQVLSYQPERGSTGTRVAVYISSLYELSTTNLALFFIQFGSRRVAATPSKLESQGGSYEYVITAITPSFSQTGWHASHVPMALLVEGGDGQLMYKVEIGPFGYLDNELPSAGSLLEMRQRRLSSGSEEMQSPAKRISTNTPRLNDEISYSYPPTGSSQFYSPMSQSSSYNMIPQYDRPNQSYQPQASSRHLYQYSSTTSSPLQRVHSPPSWTPYGSVGSQHRGSPSITSGSASRPTLTALPPPLNANPQLVRMTTLPQSTSPGVNTGLNSSHSYPFNFTGANKAVLQINGNLESMANVRDWTSEELHCKRRIVMFKRSQSGPKITTTFQPVTAEKKPQGSICISCIFWEDKEECYVTSVDTIYLLENLVAAKFTVEEKNRIRRNLEGYHPTTVSKGKQESEDFFKLIMGFPNPKPRNIEKDVKVFSWKILSGGLKKIIGKYCASPQSILPPAILTPVSSSSYGTESSLSSLVQQNTQDMHQHNSMYSPRSSNRSLSGPAHSQYSSMTRPLSPPNIKSLYNSHDGLRVSVPQYYHQQDSYSQHQQHTPTYLNPISSTSTRGPPWDLGMVSAGYLESTTGNANGGVHGTQGLSGYGEGDTPIGISIPKLLDLGGHHAGSQMPTS